MSASVTVQVPATTANLGPGYDCLGVALCLYNHVTVSRPGRNRLDQVARAAVDLFFTTTGLRPFGCRVTIAGDVPRSRGLGSSVTVRLGILAGLNALTGSPLSRQRLFELCARLEGHPDNAAPAVFGGFTVTSGGMVARFPVPAGLRFVLLVPDFEVPTPAARKVIPGAVPHADAVENVGRACRITAAFAAGRPALLRGAFADRLHQPHREQLIPFLHAVIAAGERAGALGGFLSGSGSTICCVVAGEGARARLRAEQVACAMLKATPCAAQTFVQRADNRGYRLAVPAAPVAP